MCWASVERDQPCVVPRLWGESNGDSVWVSETSWLFCVRRNSLVHLVTRFMFLVGLVIASITMSVVDSAVNTVVVAFAEGPAEFELNHPELSREMKEGLRKVYPDECGF